MLTNFLDSSRLVICKFNFLVVLILQALGYVFIARPECMLQKDVVKILVATLSTNADFRLKVLSCVLCLVSVMCYFCALYSLFSLPDAIIAEHVRVSSGCGKPNGSR